MQYHLILKKTVIKNLQKLAVKVRHRFDSLALSLRDKGPTAAHGWKNYGKLKENEFHCHLTYHNVAVWRYEKKSTTIEITYVGSRESAPY